MITMYELGSKDINLSLVQQTSHRVEKPSYTSKDSLKITEDLQITYATALKAARS